MTFHSDQSDPGPEGGSFRSRTARYTAEKALVRIVHHYGNRPEFVVLGGLVPELLCAQSEFQHAGTTDVDVQVDLEIACGAVNTPRLERALRNAEFVPGSGQIWSWRADGSVGPAVVKFELIADLPSAHAGATITFDECNNLGAVNLRGTRFAVRDTEVRELRARIGGVTHRVEVNVAGLAGFLLAKAAAFSRRKAKDWYDIAFVLLHNDAGGPSVAATRVRAVFGDEIDAIATAFDDLRANFAVIDAQGPRAYARQMLIDHPGLDPTTLAADAVLAIDEFHRGLRHRVD